MGIPVKNAREEERVARRVRVHVLVAVAEGYSRDVASVLGSKPGVVAADVVAGETDVIMVVEAHHRLELAHLTIQALAAVEAVTIGLRMMPADGY